MIGNFNKGQAARAGVLFKVRAGGHAFADKRIRFAAFREALAKNVVGGILDKERANHRIWIAPFLCHGRAEIAYCRGNQDHDPDGAVILQCALEIGAARSKACFANVCSPQEFSAFFHGIKRFWCDVQEIAGEVGGAGRACGDGYKRARVLELFYERFCNGCFAGAGRAT